jgi:hypothetical protein
MEVSQYTTAMSYVLVGNYGLLTASMTDPWATVLLPLRLVFNAIMSFSVCVHVLMI